MPAVFRGCSSVVERLAEDQEAQVRFLPATFLKWLEHSFNRPSRRGCNETTNAQEAQVCEYADPWHPLRCSSDFDRVAQWEERLPTEQKVAGSIPAVVMGNSGLWCNW
jgi:hypothetical protein